MAVVVLGILLYQFQVETSKRNTRKAEQQSKVEAKAAYINPDNWKTYKNSQYNFEFKYPNNFLVEDPKALACSAPIDMVGPKVCPFINIKAGNFVDWKVGGDNNKNAFMEKKEMNSVFFCQSFGITDNTIYFAVKPENGNCFVVSLKLVASEDCDTLVNPCARGADADCPIAYQQSRSDCWDKIDSKDQIIKKLSGTFKFTK